MSLIGLDQRGGSEDAGEGSDPEQSQGSVIKTSEGGGHRVWSWGGEGRAR